jgi:hypothetical protein
MVGQKAAPPQQRQQNREWASLEDDSSSIHRSGLLDPNDPFGDPFADDNDTPLQENKRMQCEFIRTCHWLIADVQGEKFNHLRKKDRDRDTFSLGCSGFRFCLVVESHNEYCLLNLTIICLVTLVLY